MKIQLETTKKGYSALWEKGGGYTNTGSATIIAGPSGKALAPIYIRRRGSLACEKHALISVTIGDFIIEADHHRGDFHIICYRIAIISEDQEGKFAFVEKMYEFNNGEWDQDPPAWLEDAIQAARNKATCYHCREPHYVQ